MIEHSTPIRLAIPGLPTAPQLYVHGEQDQFVSKALRENFIWEPYETRLLLAALSQGDAFLDIGANLGYFSVVAAQKVGPTGRVFAFEPDPDNCRALRASVQLNGFTSIVEVVEAALADQAGEARLYLCEDNLGDHQIYAGEPGRESVPITLLNGADFLRGRLAQLALVKIDTQGSEYQVVVGLLPFLAALARPPRMIIELTPWSLREARASGRALIDQLASLQLPFWIIDHVEHRLVASTAEELALWCDNVDACEGDRGFMNILVGEGLAGV